MRKLNIPTIKNIETALNIYYRHPEIGNKEIAELFGNISNTRIAKLKQIVKVEMIEKNIMSYSSNKINTEVAFVVWGLDVENLAHRMRMLSKLKLA